MSDTTSLINSLLGKVGEAITALQNAQQTVVDALANLLHHNTDIAAHEPLRNLIASAGMIDAISIKRDDAGALTARDVLLDTGTARGTGQIGPPASMGAADLNTLTASGVYVVAGGSPNSPGGHLLVIVHNQAGENTGNIRQTAYRNAEGDNGLQISTRLSMDAGITWSEWTRIDPIAYLPVASRWGRQVASAGSGITLPAGGTWAYIVCTKESGNLTNIQSCSVAAGGSEIAPPGTSAYHVFHWRLR